MLTLEELATILAQHTFFRMKNGYKDIMRCACGDSYTARNRVEREKIEGMHQALMIWNAQTREHRELAGIIDAELVEG